MKVCEHCNTDNPDQANFCRNCGKPLSGPRASEQNIQHVQPEEAPANQPANIPNASTTSVQPTGYMPPTPSPQRPYNDGTTAGATEPAPSSPPAPFDNDNGAGTAAPTSPSNGTGTAMPSYPSPSAPINTPPAGIPYNVQPTMQPNMQPVMQTAPVQHSEFGRMLNWMWASFKRPSQRFATAAWWPIIPIACNSLLIAIGAFSIESRGYNSTLGRVSVPANSLLKGLGSSSSIAPTLPITEFFKTLFLFIAFFYLIIALTFAGIKMLGDSQRSFTNFHVEMAQKLMPLMAVNILIALCGLMGSWILIGLLLMLEILYILLIPPTIVAEARNYRNLDKTWMWIFTTMLIAFAVIVIFMIFTALGLVSLASQLMSSL